MTELIDRSDELLDMYAQDEDPNYGFWSQRPILLHVYRFARSRRVSPWAVLACVLRRAISCVPPNVQLPPLVGGATSLNLFSVTLGISGQGKGAADAAGFAAIFFPSPDGEALDAPRPNIGTGEGLARLFKGGNGQDAMTRAHLMVPEVGALAALADRQGATIGSQLLQAYMGEPLGFSNAHKDTTTAVEAHSYRLCLGIGAQPENAGFFIHREKDGFPQRFLWVSAIDPYAPRERPKPVAPVDVHIPQFGGDEHQIAVPPSVAEAIDANRHLSLIGSPDVDPLDGHLMLTRLKVSFGLAILDGRRDISEDDWKVGGELIDASTRVRASARAAIEEHRRRVNRARAHDQADRQAIIDEKLTDRQQHRVARSIKKTLDRQKRATKADLRRACAAAIRPDFEPVFGLLLGDGVIVSCEGVNGGPVEYELARE